MFKRKGNTFIKAVEIFQGTRGLYYFRVKAYNNEIVCGSEGYRNEKDCEETAMKLFPNSDIFYVNDEPWNSSKT